jgi:hypothetical protein
MAVTWNYNASSSTNIDTNLTDFEGAADANGFSIYVPTRMTFNPATNSTTVVYSYMLHERGNNFSLYSQTTWNQYKTNGAASYTRPYAPSTTAQYTAMTTNSYYWMGNSDNTPPIAFASIPSSGTVSSPTGTWSWSFTVNHDINGSAPATTIQAYCDSNTNASYVPVGTTITATLTTLLNSATYNLNYTAPYYTTGFSSGPTLSRTNNGATLSITPSNAVVINVASNNTVTYTYEYSINGGAWSGATTSSAGWSNISVTPTDQLSVVVRARINNTAQTSTTSAESTYAGIPLVATNLSATESSTQSRDVTISWTVGSGNGSTITSQTLEWSTGTSDATFSSGYVGGVILDATTSSYTITPGSAPTGGTSVLLPSTNYTYRVTTTNAVGSNGTSVTSGSPGFTTRASSPLISPSAGTAPNTRSSTKVWNGSAMVQAQVSVYDGSTWKYLK